MHLWHEYQSKDDVFSLYSIKWYIISIGLSADAIDFDHVVKVVSARPFTCEFSNFPFEISKYLGIRGDTLRLHKYPILHQTQTLSTVSRSVWIPEFPFYLMGYNLLDHFDACTVPDLVSGSLFKLGPRSS